MSSRIQAMNIKEIEEVLTIERKSFPTPWTRGMFELELRNPSSHLFLSKELRSSAERIRGYICFWHVCDEVHLLNVAVHPEFRRQGVATELLSFAFDYSIQRHMSKAFLEVRAHNQPAQRLYQKIGFYHAGIRKRYYQDTGEDALLLELDLTSAGGLRKLESSRGDNSQGTPA